MMLKQHAVGMLGLCAQTTGTAVFKLFCVSKRWEIGRQDRERKGRERGGQTNSGWEVSGDLG